MRRDFRQRPVGGWPRLAVGLISGILAGALLAWPLDSALGGYGHLGLRAGAGLGGIVGLATAAVALGKWPVVRTLLLVGGFATSGVLIAAMLDPRDAYEARADWYVGPTLAGAAFGSAMGAALGLRMPVSVGSLMVLTITAGIAMGLVEIERGVTVVMPLLALIGYVVIEGRRLPSG